MVLVAATTVLASPQSPVAQAAEGASSTSELVQTAQQAPGVPTNVTATTGPGRSTVAFTPADASATSFSVTAWKGGVAEGAATGKTSPVLIWGLSYGSSYTFTVSATNAAGSSEPSLPSSAVKPTGPVSNAVPLSGATRFINQSTSFNSTAGTASSRRPQSSESLSASLYNPPIQGVPAGSEWQVLWLRAVNCEAAPRQMEFFVQQESAPAGTVAKFVQGDTWRTGQANRTVAVTVSGSGGQLSWVSSPAAPLVVSAGQSLGARWYGMVGGGTGCNWQFGAIERPAGSTSTISTGPATQAAPSATFKGDVAGTRASWRTVPSGDVWVPERLTARNCETGPRRMEVLLLGPGNITQGVVTPSSNGSGPAVVPAGGTFDWDAAVQGSRLVLPEGWALGVRWLDMKGDAPSSVCSWSAVVSTGKLDRTQ